MLAKSDTSIDLVVAALAQYGVEAAYFVPTDTGMTKSIVDAHQGIRRFLMAKGLHDFDMQRQGPDNKKKLKVKLVFSDHTDDRELSLYRPQTKNGDPRLWIGRLGEYADPFNLIAIFVDSIGTIYVVNCSRSDIWTSKDRSGTPFHQILNKASKSDVAEELLDKLTDISSMGFVDSGRDGPTGIGFTLETLLGIRANSNRAPDYKGIELKSGRMPASGTARNRSTMFSQIPKWEISRLKSGKEILRSYGYHNADRDRQQLYCSISSSPNSQGLFIRVNSSGELIENLAVKADGTEESVVVWVLSELEAALATKHKETFWVKAQQRRSGKIEQFHFTNVVHTRSPLVSNFGLLVDSGKIEIDYTLSSKPSGGSRDHGYLFKLWPRNFDLIFPPPINYVLSV
jgi:hypothetical protein